MSRYSFSYREVSARCLIPLRPPGLLSGCAALGNCAVIGDRPRRRAPGDEGRPHRDCHRAECGPGEVLRSRATSGFGIYGDANAGQARDDEQDAGRRPGAGQACGRHQLAPAHQEQGSSHDPPIGSGVASQHANRLPDRGCRRPAGPCRRSASLWSPGRVTGWPRPPSTPEPGGAGA